MSHLITCFLFSSSNSCYSVSFSYLPMCYVNIFFGIHSDLFLVLFNSFILFS